MYMIVREKRNAFLNFVVTNQKFSVKSDTIDFENKTTFKGSPDNDLFYEYTQYSNELGKLMIDSTVTKAQKDSVTKEILAYQANFAEEHPSHPLSTVFQLSAEVEIPQSLKDMKGAAGDEARYYYYIAHYWDNVDFSSPCLLRTPTFHGKLQRYFDKYVPQHYDSIPRYADLVCGLAKANEENFKYVVNYLTFKWESGKEKRMCWDKVFYHMAREYYLSFPTQTPWVDDAQMAKIKSRVEDLTYALCSEKAVPLHIKQAGYTFPVGLPDTLGVYHDFQQMPEDYVVLWFWDSDCGHCKKQTPVLWEMYQKYLAEGKSLEVLAINVEQDSEGYKKYLRENKYSWVNVQDTTNWSRFRDYYDIYSTPVAFILDKDRNIIGKRIDPTAMDNLFKQIFANDEKKKLEAKKED